jgi:hypothetical protein
VASSIVFTLEMCHVTVAMLELFSAPSHLNVASESDSPARPIASNINSPSLAMVMWVPSCGAIRAA